MGTDWRQHIQIMEYCPAVRKNQEVIYVLIWKGGVG